MMQYSKTVSADPTSDSSGSDQSEDLAIFGVVKLTIWVTGNFHNLRKSCVRTFLIDDLIKMVRSR